MYLIKFVHFFSLLSSGFLVCNISQPFLLLQTGFNLRQLLPMLIQEPGTTNSCLTNLVLNCPVLFNSKSMPHVILVPLLRTASVSAYSVERHETNNHADLWFLDSYDSVDILFSEINILRFFEVDPNDLEVIENQVYVSLVVGCRPFQLTHRLPVVLWYERRNGEEHDMNKSQTRTEIIIILCLDVQLEQVLGLVSFRTFR